MNYEDQIKKAKHYPIIQLFQEAGLVVKNNMVSCPFHNDKTPSLKIYPDTNTYYCFGCGHGVDTINFVTEFYKKSFKHAVEFLTGETIGLYDYKIPQLTTDQILDYFTSKIDPILMETLTCSYDDWVSFALNFTPSDGYSKEINHNMMLLQTYLNNRL